VKTRRTALRKSGRNSKNRKNSGKIALVWNFGKPFFEKKPN